MAQYDDLPIGRITAVSLISIAVTISRFGVNEEDGRFQIPIEEAIKKAVRQAATASNPAEKSEGT
jgi:hypothetical protein